MSIEKTSMRDGLNLELIVADRKTHPGMYGCGMVVVNPPWTLRDDMENALPWLAEKLGQHGAASCRIEQWVDE
jgi:23S rRNA (adenine2030-N6)-methyltransferase